MADPYRRAHRAGLRSLAPARRFRILQTSSQSLIRPWSRLRLRSPRWANLARDRRIQPGTSGNERFDTAGPHVSHFPCADAARAALNDCCRRCPQPLSRRAQRRGRGRIDPPLQRQLPARSSTICAGVSRRPVGQTRRPSQTTRRACSSRWLQAIISAPPPRCLTDRRQPRWTATPLPAEGGLHVLQAVR
jgi:hypothetical protein